MNEDRKQTGLFARSPGAFVCLSAFLLALGTYLQTVEMPVRITSDPSAADQTDLMHAFWPFSFALWILAFLFLVYAIFVGNRKPLATAQSQKLFSRNRVIAAFALGVLTLVSTFLPWVIAEVANPVTDLPRYGSVNIGQYHALTGVSLISSNYWKGDVMYLVFASAVIAILYIPILAFIDKQRRDPARAFLSLLGGICVIGPIASLVATESWFIRVSFAGGSGGVQGTFMSPGIGLIIAAFSAAGLVALGIADAVKLLRKQNASGAMGESLHSVKWKQG